MNGLIASAAEGWWYPLAVTAGLAVAAWRVPRRRARLSAVCMAAVPLCLIPMVAHAAAGGDTSRMAPCAYAVIAGSIVGTAANLAEAVRRPEPVATPPTGEPIPLLPTVQGALRAAGLQLIPETADADHVRVVADRYGTVIVRWVPGTRSELSDGQRPDARRDRVIEMAQAITAALREQGLQAYRFDTLVYVTGTVASPTNGRGGPGRARRRDVAQ
ncbi:hypothetical protein [Streptomyces xiamenensis]|uniref:hypothetical protein n=1 Tax=Streptomyces xiamenensis TaxID=408015 RepID=UPI0035E23DD2